MLRKVYASIAVLVGISMIGIWTVLLFTSQVPELVTSPFSIAFHLAAEFINACFLIVGRVMLYRKHLWGEKIYLVSVGMLLYNVITSSGYYVQSGEWSFVAMFAILFALAVTGMTGLLRESKDV